MKLIYLSKLFQKCEMIGRWTANKKFPGRYFPNADVRERDVWRGGGVEFGEEVGRGVRK
jgi:hypothetical protein